MEVEEQELNSIHKIHITAAQETELILEMFMQLAAVVVVVGQIELVVEHKILGVAQMAAVAAQEVAVEMVE